MIEPLNAESLCEAIRRVLPAVGYGETSALMQIKDNDRDDDIEGAKMIEFMHRPPCGYIFLTICQVSQDGRAAWLLEGYKTIHNYPHAPDDVEDVTIATSPHEREIVEALARYEFEQRLANVQDAYVDEAEYEDWKEVGKW